jgi:hypothetical protein
MLQCAAALGLAVAKEIDETGGINLAAHVS